MRILITGATGLLGSGLAKALVEREDEVLAYLRPKSNLELLGKYAESIQWLELKEGQEPLFPKGKIDGIFHAATCFGRKGESLGEIIAANLEFPVRLLEYAQQNEATFFLNVHTLLAPQISSYSLSKHQFLEWSRCLASGPKMLHLRMDHFYGPGEGSDKFISWLFNRIRLGDTSILLTHGMQKRDFLYIGDAITACLCIMDSLDAFSPGEEVTIVGGQPIRMRELAEKCREIAGSSVFLDFGALPARPFEQDTICEADKLKSMGWQPITKLDEGLSFVWRAINSPSNP